MAEEEVVFYKTEGKEKKLQDSFIVRSVGILSKLSKDERPQIDELMEEFNVSKRTIQRDMARLKYHFPIENIDSHYFFLEGFSLNQTDLTLDELTTFSLAMDLIRNKGAQFEDQASSISSKIFHSKLFNPYYIKPFPSELMDSDSVVANTLEDAIKTKYPCRIEFSDGSVKEVDPYKLVNFDGYWFLMAAHEEKIVHYRFASIITVEQLMKKKFEILKEMSEVFTPYYTKGESIDIEIVINQKVADYFISKNHLPSQKIIKTLDNGSIHVAYEVSHLEEVDNLIKAWLPDIKVIQPASYQKKLMQELESYLKN